VTGCRREPDPPAKMMPFVLGPLDELGGRCPWEHVTAMEDLLDVRLQFCMACLNGLWYLLA